MARRLAAGRDRRAGRGEAGDRRRAGRVVVRRSRARGAEVRRTVRHRGPEDRHDVIPAGRPGKGDVRRSLTGRGTRGLPVHARRRPVPVRPPRVRRRSSWPPRLPLTDASLLTDLTRLRRLLVAGAGRRRGRRDGAAAPARGRQARARTPARWLFTDEALQQATPLPVAAHRARRLAGVGVHDLTCSIGADLVALARCGLSGRGAGLGSGPGAGADGPAQPDGVRVAGPRCRRRRADPDVPRAARLRRSGPPGRHRAADHLGVDAAVGGRPGRRVRRPPAGAAAAAGDRLRRAGPARRGGDRLAGRRSAGGRAVAGRSWPGWPAGRRCCCRRARRSGRVLGGDQRRSGRLRRCRR